MDFEISDFCFVDYTSRGILSLFSRAVLSNEIFHLVHPSRFSLKEFGDLLVKAGCSLIPMSLDEFLDEIYSLYNKDEANRDISNLFLHSPIFKENCFFPGLLYMSVRTNKLLEKVDFIWPELNCGQIQKMVEICR